jgi:hypothetical protein
VQTRGDQQAQVEPEDRVRPTILNNPVDAPDRPVLRRGIPKRSDSSDDADTTQVASNQPANNKPPAKAS